MWSAMKTQGSLSALSARRGIFVSKNHQYLALYVAALVCKFIISIKGMEKVTNFITKQSIV